MDVTTYYVTITDNMKLNLAIKYTLIFLLVFLNYGCVSYTNEAINLKKIPEAKSVINTNSYIFIYKGWWEAKEYGFKTLLVEGYDTESEKEKIKQKIWPNSGCVIDIKLSEKKNKIVNDNIKKFYTLIAGLTLFIFPSYTTTTYQAKADIFNAKTKNIIKEIKFEENAYFVNSLPLAVVLTLIPTKGWLDYSADQGSSIQSKANRKVHDAIFRQVTNDVQTIKECQY